MNIIGKLTLTCSHCNEEFETEIDITMLERMNETDYAIIFSGDVNFIWRYSGHIKCNTCIEK